MTIFYHIPTRIIVKCPYRYILFVFNMPNPDAMLLKNFFYGNVTHEWFHDNGDLHTVPQISVNEYERYFILYMKEILDDYRYHHGGVAGRSRFYSYINDRIDRWQVVHNALCDRDRTYGPVSASLEDILELDVLALPGFFV